MYKLIKHNRLLCLDNKISFIYQKILRTKSSSADDAVNKYVSVIKLQVSVVLNLNCFTHVAYSI